MILLALFVAAALTEPAPDADAGVKAFAEGRYEDAAAILERAYAAEPEPDLLFAWAQAERYAGHCHVAVPLFREYLHGQPPADVRALAREAIEACGEDPDVEPVPEPEPELEPMVGPEPEPEPEPEPDAQTDLEPRSRPAARDPWGHALTWPGVALVAVGGGLLGEAHRRRAQAERASDELGYREALDGAPVLSRAGIAVLVGGGALLTAGIIRFAVVASRGRRGREQARLRPSGVGLSWRFELAPRRARALP